MFCVIYKSTKHNQIYLYLKNKNDFSRVPKALLKRFGHPQLIMELTLTNRTKLVNSDINQVIQDLKNQGYYLQIFSKKEDTDLIY